MADEPRRSGRATKGQHTKHGDIPEAPAAKRAKGSGKSKAAKQTSAEPTPSDEEDDNAVVRCICGASEDDGGRMMIQCDKCEVWQHNECMEVTEVEEDMPDRYLCEQCAPDDHKELLAKVERGERPWEEREKEREREEEEKRARRRKGGKKGGARGGRQSKSSDVKSEVSEEMNGKSTPEQEEAANGDEPEAKSASSKRKLSGDDSGFEPSGTPEKEPQTKVRKVSSQDVKHEKPTPQRQGSASGAAGAAGATPARKDSKSAPAQTEKVSEVGALQDEARRKIAAALAKIFGDLVRDAQKQGSYSLPAGQRPESVAAQLALGVEHAVFITHSAEANEAYRTKCRSIMFNIKKNPALRDRLLSGSLSSEEFSQMSTDEMASEELQQRNAEMKTLADKQHMLIQEEGPRIRRTHKGEELVEDDEQLGGSHETIFNPAAPRRRESQMETSEAKSPDHSPGGRSESPATVELPEDVGVTRPAAAARKPPKLDIGASPKSSVAARRSSSAFNIQDVWSSVQSPDTEKQRSLSSAQPPSRKVSEHQPGSSSAVGADPEIDQLLKDEEPDSPPYSPTDYHPEPGVIWQGKVSMSTMAEFSASAKHVGGADLSINIPWSQLIPETLSVDGRIDVNRANQYLCGLRWSQTTDVSVLALTPSGRGPAAQADFDKLFNYFSERKRYGVVGKHPDPAVKDIYVVPLDAGMGKKPDFVEILEHCTIEEPRPERMFLVTFVVRANTTPSSASQAGHTSSSFAPPPAGTTSKGPGAASVSAPAPPTPTPMTTAGGAPGNNVYSPISHGQGYGNHNNHNHTTPPVAPQGVNRTPSVSTSNGTTPLPAPVLSHTPPTGGYPPYGSPYASAHLQSQPPQQPYGAGAPLQHGYPSVSYGTTPPVTTAAATAPIPVPATTSTSTPPSAAAAATNPAGHALAVQILGPLADTPVVHHLLATVPTIGAPEFGVVKQILEQVPAARNDIGTLTSILQSRQ
ncbi:SPOC-domain-containing protein [Xylona heveae TC161]|uniref:Transcription factor BYE1 n=1 Tax=Xylona heveae (strain CBS 132557 / TC161) TaxID=1328760 RepID=A0A165FK81_XYLHT|nr:SPOC-domain-containing protein [Xylona heveae TC161]KZF21075.1 SPOC-domain-containing protein [Xylona heveae TC161]